MIEKIKIEYINPNSEVDSIKQKINEIIDEINLSKISFSTIDSTIEQRQNIEFMEKILLSKQNN